jgi:host factor-I protein
MTKNMTSIEEAFLSSAKEGLVSLRLSLANRERINGVVTFAGKYDLNLDTGNGIVTLPKKDIFHISPSRPLLEETVFAIPEAEEILSGKSRVQDEFLNKYIKEKILALFRLTNGDELRGVMDGYDGFTISIKTSRGQVLLYKHGLCSIGPGYRHRQGKDDAR